MSFEDFLNKARTKKGDKLGESTKEAYLTIYNRYKIELHSKAKLISWMNSEIKEKKNMIMYSSFRLFLLYKKYDKKQIKNNLEPPEKISSALTSESFLTKKVLGKNELKDLITKGDLLNRFICSFAYDTAGRRDELINARFMDTIFKNQEKIAAEINIIGKGRKARTVYITKYTYNLLKELHGGKAKRKDTLILDLDKYERPEKFINDSIRKHSKKIIDRHVHPHMFRHTKATHMANKGASPLDIMAYLGHNNINTTMIYIKFSSYTGKRAFNKYSEEFS